MFRNLSPRTDERIKEATRKFLSAAALEESTIVLDGPGIGCTSHTIALGYLGLERIFRLKAIHSFSSSSYGTMGFIAMRDGTLTMRAEDVIGWNRGNQRRHQLTFPGSVLTKLPSLIRRGYLFSNQRAEDALTCSSSQAFVQKKVRDLPPNVHFWVYNKTEKRNEDIHAGNPVFADWTMGEVIRAAVSIPYIYETFIKDGKEYRDPMFSPTLRELMRELRTGANVLFWNTKYSATKQNLIAVKGHESKNGLRRIIVDELLFLLGIDNPEFDEGMKKGFFETSPLRDEG
jgi:hypothetical protein